MWPYPEIKNVADIVRYNAKNYSDKPGTIFCDHTLSWADIDELSNRMANGLRAENVDAKDRVLYFAGNADDYFLTIYASAKIGAAFIPLNWRLCVAEIAAIVEDSAPKIALVDLIYKDTWDEVQSKLPQAVKTIYIDPAKKTNNPFWQWASNFENTDPNYVCEGDSTAWQIYTSGTTGAPKGVELTHAGIMNMRLCEHFEPAYTWGETDRYLFCVPSFHLLGLGLSMQAMYNGACVLIAPQFDPEKVLTLINTHKPTLMGLAPVMIQFLLDHPNAATTDFSGIREMLYAGSPISKGLLKRAIEAIPCKFMQFYGATESGGAITLLRPDDHDLDNDSILTSCGKPLPLIDMKIIDAEGNSLPANAPGEMVIRAPSITKGYWNKPEAWKDVYENGWYKTGDVGYYDDNGYFYLIDRAKDMIVSGGENIYCSEVENCLSLHGAVAAAAIIGVPSEKWGEEVKAFIMLKPGQSTTDAELIAHCKANLAGYKCPKSIEFVSDFPRTGAGKVSKKDLRAPYWEGQGRSV